MHNFTSFYYKELLQKMQISIFEKYIPYTDSKETMLISAWSDMMPSPHTEQHPNGLKAKVIDPNVWLQFLPSYCPLPW